MWIECTNPATRRLFNETLMDDPVAFSENGTAQVSREVGEAMCDHYDDVRPYSADDTE